MRRMGARFLFIVSISICLLPGNDCAHAQNAPGTVQEPPPIVVTATKPSVKRGRAQNATPTARTMPTLVMYPTTPISGSGIDPQKVPASVNIVDAGQIKQTGSLNVSDALQKYVPGIVVNEVAGNPFQPNVQFRGFDASPVSGTPQGLAVYQNGVRINEAFGDTVNWDLIPTVAVRTMDVISNNPAFGLNALGGAISMQMKDGFTWQGTSIDVMGGSYGRAQASLQWGKVVGPWSAYIAIEGAHDDGYRQFGSSEIRRLYGDIGYRNAGSEFHITVGAADNFF